MRIAIAFMAMVLVGVPFARGDSQRTFTVAGGSVRVIVNKPGDFDPARPTQLIIYTCPNGNSAEQTLGARLEPGMDWHFDIQHVAAQVRKLRQVDTTRNIVVAVLEADVKSWPAWRKARGIENGKIIRGIVDEIAQRVPGKDLTLTLAGHSGGGSFVFGYLNGGDAIADNVDRIAWLDANYAYDEADHHGDKLLAWLKGDPKRHLVVFAYDDSQITLNGKPVLKNPMGGTFGSSKRMIERLSKDVELTKATRGPFETWSGMNGQIDFLIHPNPEKKILHTVLVERNGLLEAMTVGTPLAGKWGGEFWGPRSYSDRVEPLASSTTKAATTKAATTKAATTKAATTKTSSAAGIPPRPGNALGGKAFAETIADLPPKAREAAIVQEITRGNVPEFLRKFVTVTAGGCTLDVMPDYLAIGSDADFVRMPMTPASGMAIAEAFGCTLPTRKMVNDIYAAATVKLEPKPMTDKREAVETFIAHNAIVEQQRVATGKPLSELVAGDKKDVVLSNRLKEKPNRVAIYGWHKPDGKPIQPVYIGHGDFYVDYSHGIRLVKRDATVDGKPTTVDAILRDPKRCELLSDEGVIDARY